jgi:5-methylcytosine-specific restriction endonuclease McrA
VVNIGPLEIPLPVNDDVERIARVVDALIESDDAAAEAELAPIAGLTRTTKPIERMPFLARNAQAPRLRTKTKNPVRRVIAGVFVRDGFTCSYCGRRTIPPNVLRVLSARFDEAFPWSKNWKPAHRAYWDISTSLDHVTAVSQGGAWNEIANLATTCYRCQEQKGNLTGWPISRPSSDWDGLTKSYEALWMTVQPTDGDHQAWIRAFRGAWDELK